MSTIVSEPVAELISVDNKSSPSGYSLGPFTPDPNQPIVVFAFMQGAGTPTISDTTSLTWNLIRAETWYHENDPEETQSGCALWWARASATPPATVITVVPNPFAEGAYIQAYAIDGPTLDSPVAQSFYTRAQSDAVVGIFASAMKTTNVYMACVAKCQAGSWSPPSGWTEVADGSIGSPLSNFSGAYRSGGETGTTVTFTLAGNQWWGMLGVEISGGYAQSVEGGLAMNGSVVKAISKNVLGTLAMVGVLNTWRKFFTAFIEAYLDPEADIEGYGPPTRGA